MASPSLARPLGLLALGPLRAELVTSPAERQCTGCGPTKPSDVMRKRLPAPQFRRADGLCRVTLVVPESCAEGLRDLARVLRGRQRERTANPAFGWRRISPSAELMVDPACGARCAIRDTRGPGAARYHWTVTVVGEPDPVASGRAEQPAEARSQAEAALAGHCAVITLLAPHQDVPVTDMANDPSHGAHNQRFPGRAS
jgi:hypothetical protein